jgi:DNA repair exonuclease SbcCD ATPase subunit
MKILDVYLENYIGILEGTNRKEIEVNFRPMFEENIRNCLFLGRNGAGKTCLLNALTPFPSQNDERSSFLVPQKAGRKVLTFDRNGSKIICDIRWSSKGKTSCFMFLDNDAQPTPLTAKGNVTQYLQAIEEELGVQPEFLKIGRVGNRVSSFLDLGPGPRKNYIGKFMPEVEEWSVMYRNAAKRSSMIKGQLQGLQVELERIEPRTDLEATIARSTSELDHYRNEDSQLDVKLGTSQGIITELTPSRLGILNRANINSSSDNFNPLSDKKIEIENSIEKTTKQLEIFIEERPLLKNFLDSEVARLKAIEIQSTINRGLGELDATVLNRKEIRAKLDLTLKSDQEIKATLNKSTHAKEQLEKLSNEESINVNKLEKLKENYVNPIEVPENLTYENIKVASDALQDLQSEISDLKNAFPNLEMLELAYKFEMDEDALKRNLKTLNDALEDVKNRLETAKLRIVTIESQASFYNRFSGLHCNDSHCPFESYIGQFTNTGTEVAEKKLQIESFEKRIHDLEQNINDLNQTITAAKNVQVSHKRIKKYREVYELANIWNIIGPATSFYNLVNSTNSEVFDKINVTTLLESIGSEREISETSRILNTIQNRIKDLENLQESQDQLLKNSESISLEIHENQEKLKAVDEKIKKIENIISSQRSAYDLIDGMIQIQNRLKELNEELLLVTSLNLELEVLRGRWETAEAEITSVKSEKITISKFIKTLEEQLSKARLNLDRRNEYETRVGEMINRLKNAQIITEACHPAKGAPIEFLKDFLDITRNSVNDLLDIALKGEFRIGFSLTENEFRIPVSKGSGRIISDITEASEGQLALTKTILSLALVKQTIKNQSGYNIISFDEIDGMLDREKNRERFVEIVNQLSTELGIEQLLMISHNDSFQAQAAGLIIFPGHAMDLNDPSFINNKVILADLS